MGSRINFSHNASVVYWRPILIVIWSRSVLSIFVSAMPYLSLSLLIQIALVVHAIRTGRDRLWVWVLILAPVVGSVAYFIIELLPELLGARRVRSLQAKAKRALDPGAELRSALEALETVDTAENRQRYARALLENGDAKQALALLETTVTGVHARDPQLLVDLAAAAFAAGDPQRCVATLDRVREIDPTFVSGADRHLLYARALEGSGRLAEATVTYENLVPWFPGEEARFRLAQLLSHQGERERANALYAEIVERQRRAPRDYRDDQRVWVEEAKRMLAG